MLPWRTCEVLVTLGGNSWGARLRHRWCPVLALVEDLILELLLFLLQFLGLLHPFHVLLHADRRWLHIVLGLPAEPRSFSVDLRFERQVLIVHLLGLLLLLQVLLLLLFLHLPFYVALDHIRWHLRRHPHLSLRLLHRLTWQRHFLFNWSLGNGLHAASPKLLLLSLGIADTALELGELILLRLAALHDKWVRVCGMEPAAVEVVLPAVYLDRERLLGRLRAAQAHPLVPGW